MHALYSLGLAGMGIGPKTIDDTVDDFGINRAVWSNLCYLWETTIQNSLEEGFFLGANSLPSIRFKSYMDVVNAR